MFIVLMFVLMMVVMLVVIVIMVVVMMVMVVAAAGAVRVMLLVVMMMVLMLVRLVLGAHLGKKFLGKGHLVDGGEDGPAGKLVPGGGENGGGGVLLPQQGNSGLQLLLRQLLGAGEDEGAGRLHLIVVKLTEVLHVDPDLAGVHHGNGAAQHHGAPALGHGILNGHDDVAELAHAGGLDQHAVGVEPGHHVLQRLVEVAHQRAADAAGGHLGDLHAGFLQKAAVDADLTEFVLDQHQLLALIDLGKELFDQSGLACAQKTGENINFCHVHQSFVQSLK